MTVALLVACAWALVVSLAAPRPAGAQGRAPGDVEIDGPPPPTPPDVISRDRDRQFTLRAVRISEALVIDGVLGEEIYRSSLAAADFIQQEPREGDAATEKTDVWVFFDGRNIYVAARCWDSHPERIVANEMKRDSHNIFQNDNFAVILDTFYDRRNGFLFHTNPVGGLFDGYVTDERDVARDWNTVWRSKSRRFDQGWTVEMAIPFKSLRYRPGGTQIWGVNFRRIVRWKNETSHLAPIPASYGMRGLNKLSSAGTLVGVEPPGSSRNLELKPYAISGLRTERTADPPVANDVDGDAGFDLKYGVTRSLTFDFTYNTDFAQVEDDEQQVNLTRFSLFFPEKREFFLEGQGIFSFGGVQRNDFFGGPPSDTPVIFFSRRIGLNDGQSVPLRAGGRLTGRAGKFSVGALNIQTGESTAAGAAATNFSVVRVKRDFLRRSMIGVIATQRSPSLDLAGANTAFGVDANLAFFANLHINSYYALTRTPGVSGDDRSYRAQLDYAGDRYGLQVEHLAVGESFRPDVGFLRRDDFRRSFAQARFSPRPKAIKAVRKLSYEASLDYVTDGRRRLETREAQLTFRGELQNGDRFNVEYSRNFEYLDAPFEIADDVAIPVGAYRFQEVRSTYQLGPQRKVSGWITVGRGSFFSGDRDQASYRGRVELSSRVSLEPGISYNWVRLAEGRFTTRLVSTRATFALSPQALVAALVQYNSSSDTLATNLRFRWEYQPGSDLFIVYSEGRETLGRGYPLLQNRTFVVKLSRLFRF